MHISSQKAAIKTWIEHKAWIITKSSSSNVSSKQHSILLAYEWLVHCETLHVFHLAVKCQHSDAWTQSTKHLVHKPYLHIHSSFNTHKYVMTTAKTILWPFFYVNLDKLLSCYPRTTSTLLLVVSLSWYQDSGTLFHWAVGLLHPLTFSRTDLRHSFWVCNSDIVACTSVLWRVINWLIDWNDQTP